MSDRLEIISVLPFSENYRIVYMCNNIIGFIFRRQCGVAIPKGHIYYGKTDNEINCSDYFPEVHGMLTSSISIEEFRRIQSKFATYPEIEQDSWIIGWDYNHFDDTESWLSYGIKPTLEILKNECISVCEHCNMVK